MKESKILEQLLVKYRLVSPIRYFIKRKILKSKRSTLVKILKIKKIDSLFVSAAVHFTDLFNKFGFKLSLAGGARAFAAAAAFCMLIIISSSLAVAYNYGRISQYIIALIGVPDSQKGFIVGANEYVKIIRDHRELPPAKAKDRLITKDEIITDAGGTVVFQIEKNTLVRIMAESSVAVEIGLEVKSILLKQGTVLCNVRELGKDEKFGVTTPGAVIFITGTQFSVTYENERTTLAVAEGSVLTENLRSRVKMRVGEGKTAVIFGDGIDLNDSGEPEKLILRRFGRLEYMNDIMKKSELETNKFWEVVTAPDAENKTGKEEDIKITTPEDIQRKYGKLEEVELYNGRKYTGAIVSRGGIYSLVTVDGIKKIPGKDIKNVRIIK